jgi:Leucine Rich repeat
MPHRSERALGQLLLSNTRLQRRCSLGNDGLANLLLSADDGMLTNNSVTHLQLGSNNITGAEGGGKLTFLLQFFLALNVLDLDGNHLGPLGARALLPGLALW